MQGVFLLSISVNKENLEDFYNISPMFMLDEEFVQMLIREKNYEVLIRTCFKTIKATKQGYKQGKQRHENKAPFSHTGLRNGGNF